MQYFPAALQDLTDQFARLPGVGGKTAQRLAFHVLSLPYEDAQAFADSIIEAKNTTWISSHLEMDKLTELNPEEYVLSYMTVFPNKAAVLVVDINKEKVKETLSSIDTTEGAEESVSETDSEAIGEIDATFSRKSNRIFQIKSRAIL